VTCGAGNVVKHRAKAIGDALDGLERGLSRDKGGELTGREIVERRAETAGAGRRLRYKNADHAAQEQN